MLRPPLVVVAVAVAVVVAAPARRAQACDQIIVPNLDVATFPRDGAVDVAANVTPFVNTFTFPNARLVDADGVDVVGVDVVDHDVTGPFLRQLVPAAPLAAGAYSIESDAGRVAGFVVGVDVDDAPPAAPTSTSTPTLTAPDPDSTGFECSFPGSGAFVVNAEADALLVAAAVDLENTLLGRALLTASTSQSLTVLAYEPLVAHVVAVDAAGHVSDALAVDIDLPPPVGCFGCTQASTSTSALALLALALLARRRFQL